MILICYDGSADAQSAVDRAAELLDGEEATVLSVWEGFAEVLARSGGGFGVAAMDSSRSGWAASRTRCSNTPIGR